MSTFREPALLNTAADPSFDIKLSPTPAVGKDLRGARAELSISVFNSTLPTMFSPTAADPVLAKIFLEDETEDEAGDEALKIFDY